MNNRVKSLLGICMKAGLLKTGEDAVERALRAGTASLVIISIDASDNTRSKFLNKSHYYNIPVKVYGSRDDINKAIGKQNRVTLAIIDKNLSGLIESAIDDNAE